MNQNLSPSRRNQFYRFLAVFLAGTTLSQTAILPLLAEGTTAGTTISNEATATYEDDDGNDLGATSNTVSVQVAKIHGITNVPNGFSVTAKGAGNANNNIVQTGDTVEFQFEITNTGNDLANIVIPGLDDTDSDTNNDIATRGLDTATLTVTVNAPSLTVTGDENAGFTVENVPANTSITVTVSGNVTATAAGAPIEVQLGDTGSNGDPNNPLADTQNQEDASDGANANEVRTVNAPGAAVTGDPANGQREASALNQVLLGANKRALVQIRKTNAGVDNNATGDNITDDSITYNLELEVQQNTPNALFTPAPLEGRDLSGVITDDASTGVNLANVILISDAIPENTNLNAAPTPANANWIPVYSIDTNAVPGDEISWTTQAPTDLTTVTRVGFIYDAETNGAIANDGVPITGFSFTVNIDVAGTPGSLSIANIAQVFGTTDDETTGTTDGAPVFDESGDSNPSNFNDDGSLGPDEDDPESDGIADPANHGTDANNNNTGQGPGGEDNVIALAVDGAILNGPDNAPGGTGTLFGVGPDNDHDFQNKSVPTPTDTTPEVTTYDPDPTTFTNTLNNPGGTPLTDVLLQPIAPGDFSLGGRDTDLPDGTVITVNFSGQQATYTYIQATGLFNLTAGTPIVIPSIGVGTTVDYTVEVDLPANTELSTDLTDEVIDGTRSTPGFPVPMIAFVDSNGNGSPDAGTDTTANVTVDQVYTGFLQLIKQVALLDVDGTPLEEYTDTPTFQPQPGQQLKYRVVYRNISDPQTGSGTNVVLNANNVAIVEDGTTGTPNNWALDNDGDGNLDTLNVLNSVDDSSQSSVVNFYNGSIDPTDASFPTADPNNLGTVDPGDSVTGYTTIVPTVEPTGVGSTPVDATPGTDDVNAGYQRFIFIRRVNDQ